MIVARNDGSVVLQQIDVTGKLLVDGEDILSPKAAIWKNSSFDPAKHLLQPDPAKKVVEKDDPGEDEPHPAADPKPGA